ncbi:class II glutamine amidotransferase [Nocardia carnea]|uniref:class II glutamine amidotransferase n=1 Tax=Nocardia carnea TaxID=37328 RepID=UPI0024561395|nr:class II glutamine amidotransferase [Nocardia carnea]
MCLLTYFPPDVAPDLLALQHGAAVNPHGHGFAVIAAPEHRIIVGRGMRADKVIDRFLAVRHRYPAGAALFHSRYATQGVRGIDNCHPFRLGGDPRTVLAHNGTLPKRVRPRAYDRRSDTRIAAEDYLPTMPFGSIDTHRGARGLETWLGSNKLVLLTVDPSYRQSAYIFGERAGVWDDGIWYSNTTYKAAARMRMRRVVSLCRCCGRADLDRVGRYCTHCGWCFACEGVFPRCDCTGPTPAPAVSDQEPARARFSHAPMNGFPPGP